MHEAVLVRAKAGPGVQTLNQDRMFDVSDNFDRCRVWDSVQFLTDAIPLSMC